jgi:hypothetical protein
MNGTFLHSEYLQIIVGCFPGCYQRLRDKGRTPSNTNESVMRSTSPTPELQEVITQAQSDVAWTMQRLLELQRRIQQPNSNHPDLNVADRAPYEKHLAMAQEHIAMDERDIARQRELVKKLEPYGPVSEQAKALLAQFEASHSMHIADRDRLKQELIEVE